MDPIADAYGCALKAKTELSNLYDDFERGRREIAVQQGLAAMNEDFKRKVAAFARLGIGDVKWEKRIQQLNKDAEDWTRLLNIQLGQMFRSRQEEEKRALLGNRGNVEQDTQNLRKERKGIDDSISTIQSVIESGRSIIGGLDMNNNLVKGAHRKALNVAGQIGVSDALINVMAGRNAQDRCLVLGCSCFTIFVFCVLWYFVKM